MPRITFLPANMSFAFDPASPPGGGHGKPGSILDIALHAGFGLDHACGGNCACTTCHVIVKEGEVNLSPMEDEEADRLEMAAALTLHSRLGCQAVPQGDVVVEVPDWNRNYF